MVKVMFYLLYYLSILNQIYFYLSNNYLYSVINPHLFINSIVDNFINLLFSHK